MLVDGSEHPRDRSLEDLVLERRDADRPRELPIVLRDAHATHGQRVVSTGTKPLQQRPEVLLQAFCILLRSLSVDADRTVLAR